MIKKIKWRYNRYRNINMLNDKLNEVIDVVNELQKQKVKSK